MSQRAYYPIILMDGSKPFIRRVANHITNGNYLVAACKNYKLEILRLAKVRSEDINLK